MNRITFVHAPEVYYEQNYGARFAPVWAYTLASYLPGDWEARVVDLSIEDLAQVEESRVFAFSGQNQDFHSIRRAYTAVKARFPNATFILGGPIVWSYEKNGTLSELHYFDHLFVLDGEETLPRFLGDFTQRKPSPKIIRGERFGLLRARPLHFEIFRPKAREYYGAVLEVSRGCPFLCEFCDIRVLPQNNESHTKSPKLIVEELAQYYALGVRQIQFACDNFIGDLHWAGQCVDAILAWTESTGHTVALHTWVTVNISDHPDLLHRMRRAGFTSLFIGVESFNASSILETSKVQNRNDKNQMVRALETIHSHGFIVAPGLIFGFDSDGPEMFETMASGVRQSGLIGGDPTFLLALPGTPLYQRMKMTGRLVEYDKTKSTLALHEERVSKVQSNIRYLQPKEFLIEGFLRFVREFTSASFNYERFRRHVELVMRSTEISATHAVGYGNLKKFLLFQAATARNARMFLVRVFHLLKPWNLATIVRGYALVLRYRRRYPGLKNHFMFWLFTWSNLLVKYSGLKASEFRLHSVDASYNWDNLWKYLEHADPSLVAGRNAEGVKVGLQYKQTQAALKALRDRLATKELSEATFAEELERLKKGA